MKRIHSRSVLLGVGLGVIITAFLGMLFFLGYQPALSNEDIIKKAEKLGMVIVPEENAKGIVRQKDGTWNIEIVAGESISTIANQLQKAGIIESELEFEINAKKNNKKEPTTSKKVLVPANMKIDELVNLLLE